MINSKGKINIIDDDSVLLYLCIIMPEVYIFKASHEKQADPTINCLWDLGMPLRCNSLKKTCLTSKCFIGFLSTVHSASEYFKLHSSV